MTDRPGHTARGRYGGVNEPPLEAVPRPSEEGRAVARLPRVTRSGKLHRCFRAGVLLSCMMIPVLLALPGAMEAALPESEEAIREIQRKRQEIEQRLRERERIEKKEREEAKEGERPVPADESGLRILVREIELQNSGLLSKKEKNGLLEPFMNREIGYNDINVLVGKITNTLIEKGYVTARVKVPLEQNLKSGKLVLTIINGYIEDIHPEKEGARRRMQVFSAFPFLEGKPLNINDLDYGIEKMNRLESNNATMRIVPGAALGASGIVIYNAPGHPVHLEAGIDNLGQETTGEYRKKLSLGLDNLASVNDLCLLTYTDGLDTDTREKYTRCYTMFMEFPLGYWTFSLMYSRSEYMQHIQGLGAPYKMAGNDGSGVFTIDRLLWRKKLGRVKGRMSLNLKEKETFIQDIKIDAQSDRLSIAEFGLVYNGYLGGGYFYWEACYTRGTRLFKASKDAPGMSADMPRAQFEKYKLNVFWNRPFFILGQGFAYSVNLSGQYGMDTLYNSEQLNIGDFYTVRGFKSYSAVGDRGYYVRNELSAHDFSGVWKRLRGLKFFTGFDYGYIIDKIGKKSDGGRGEASLAGVSAGVAYTGDFFDANLTYARKVSAPSFIKEDEYVIYAVATAKLTNAAAGAWRAFSGENKNPTGMDKNH